MGSNPTPSAQLGLPVPDSTMSVVAATSDLEDERGVDRRQIRELLALTPAQRVDRLVKVVAVWSEILASAGGPSRSQ